MTICIKVFETERKSPSSRRLNDFLILLRHLLTAALQIRLQAGSMGKAAVIRLAKLRKSSKCLRFGRRLPLCSI